MLNKLAVFVIIFSCLLAACASSAGSADASVERYLEAIVSVDEVATVNAACAAWEQQALMESAAYQGVETQLEDLDSQVISEEGDHAQVACTGQVRYSY